MYMLQPVIYFNICFRCKKDRIFLLLFFKSVFSDPVGASLIP